MSASDIAISADEDGAATSSAALDVIMPELPLVAGHGGGERARWLASLGFAALLHAAVLTAAGWRPADRVLGAEGIELEAMNVDVVSASALRSIASLPIAGTAADAAVAEREGGSEDRVAATAAPDRKAADRPDDAAGAPLADLVVPEPPLKPELPTEAPSLLTAAQRSETPAEDTRKPAEPKRVEIAAAAPSAPSDAAEAMRQGGSVATGTAADASVAPAAATLAGEMAVYGRLVQQAITRTPPRLPAGVSARGNVVINFSLGLDGSLLVARVAEPSGNTALDEAALAAVKRARFPPPPAGSDLAQLTYNFPVRYR